MSAGRPLEGVRVLDLTRVLAGPYATRMLADLGADVVKVEPPEGDVTRAWGKVIGGLSGYYTQQNVGKRDICVDLRVAGGPPLIRQLATRADVLIENFRPGVLEQHGLGYDALAELNPRLVMASVTGFGQTGPEASRPAYATVAQAESGLILRQSVLDGAPPVDPRISIADMNAALHALIGLLSALYMRERTGRGQHVDIAMFDSMLATDDYVHLALDGISERKGVVSNEVWDVVGGPLVMAGDFRWIWRKLHEAYGLVDPTPEGAGIREKSACRHQAVREFFATFDDRRKLLDAISAAGLAYGEVRSTREALEAPTAKARGVVVQVPDRADGTRPVIQSPYRFSNADSGVAGPAPHRGEHNRTVLRQWLELSDTEIEALEKAKVLLAE